MFSEHPEYRAIAIGLGLAVLVVIAVLVVLAWPSGTRPRPAASPSPAVSATPAPTAAATADPEQVARNFVTAYLEGEDVTGYLAPGVPHSAAYQGGPQRAQVSDVVARLEGVTPSGLTAVMVSAQVKGQTRFVEVLLTRSDQVEPVNG